MWMNIERYKRALEAKRILLDPLTWGQSNKAIVRFTGCPISTVRGIRQRLIAQGLTPANPNSEPEAIKECGRNWKRSHA